MGQLTKSDGDASGFSQFGAATQQTGRIPIAVFLSSRSVYDTGSEYFVSGIADDLIYALSREPGLAVTARSSSFTYRGSNDDVRQFGQDLKVRFAIDLVILLTSDDIILKTRIVDVATGEVFGTDEEAGAKSSVLDLLHLLAARLTVQITGSTTQFPTINLTHERTTSFPAYDLYLRGMAQSDQGTKDSISQALELFYKAIEQDNDFALAHAMVAWCYFWRKAHTWTESSDELSRGADYARRAVSLAGSDALVLTRCGHSLAHLTGDLDYGISLLDQAVELNPNLGAAWFLGGFLRAWRGEAEVAIRYFEQAIRLSPLDPEIFRMRAGIAMSHLFAGRLDVASKWASEAFGTLPDVRTVPGILMVLGIVTVSHTLAGHPEEAERALTHLRQLNPELRIANVRTWLPIRRPEDLGLFEEGFRRAGLPE